MTDRVLAFIHTDLLSVISDGANTDTEIDSTDGDIVISTLYVVDNKLAVIDNTDGVFVTSAILYIPV